MAVDWLSALPFPLQQGLTVRPGSAVKSYVSQSGRSNTCRWGSGPGDVLSCSILLLEEQVEIFKSYYRVDLNMGLNWIDADWLSLLGYDDHYVRITGYLRRSATGLFYSDFALTCTIETKADCPADTAWPVRW